MVGGEQYFTHHPSSESVPRTIRVDLAGRRVAVTVAAGVFSADRIDTGTRALLERTPPPPAEGDLLDLGCGWGPIALSLAHRSPAATVWAVDINDRALELTRRNADALGLDNVRAVRPEDVPPGIRFRALWSNPPIRIGKTALHDLLDIWLPRVEAGGDARLVIPRNLGADTLHRHLQAAYGAWSVTREASTGGYRLLRAHRADSAPQSGSSKVPE